ncbi:MAG: hypothetical protein TQ37_10470 [Candidatus Synechococcus spongiarum 15L]|uniref:Uncharacterized protein n=2 Tax=Candidatus Synechococcus spongiarum TaxID=431041 RepID=A0A1T1D7L2_9SYNE|nr:MAG: hypothetical protein TQ37_10470 [Candidatus Synechococcus spongiarum 15L]OOV36553.1 hypothetical protein BV53_00325 [Candidatus Synechococcus spongiarum LMB bulk15N]
MGRSLCKGILLGLAVFQLMGHRPDGGDGDNQTNGKSGKKMPQGPVKAIRLTFLKRLQKKPRERRLGTGSAGGCCGSAVAAFRSLVLKGGEACIAAGTRLRGRSGREAQPR